MTRCEGCGAEWSGHLVEHCGVCHQSFTGRAGAMHRVEDLEGRDRCLAPREMVEQGMARNTRGFWTSSSEPFPTERFQS